MAAMPPPEARHEKEGRERLSRAWPRIAPVTLGTSHWAEPRHVTCFFPGEARNLAFIWTVGFLVHRRGLVRTVVLVTHMGRFIRKQEVSALLAALGRQ